MQKLKERKFLQALVAAQTRQPLTVRRRVIVSAVTWLASVLLFFAAFQFLGMPSADAWPWLACTFAMGLLVSVWAVREAHLDQWPVLKNHIDFEGIKSRLAELER